MLLFNFARHNKMTRQHAGGQLQACQKPRGADSSNNCANLCLSLSLSLFISLYIIWRFTPIGSSATSLKACRYKIVEKGCCGKPEQMLRQEVLKSMARYLPIGQGQLPVTCNHFLSR